VGGWLTRLRRRELPAAKRTGIEKSFICGVSLVQIFIASFAAKI
jgi:hypothetical protein